MSNGAPPPPPTYGQQPPPPGGQQPYDPQYYGQYPQPKSDGKAIWSLVLGILSLICCGLFAAVPAVILGHMSTKAIDESQGYLTGRGMAMAGLIMGYISIGITVLAILANIFFGFSVLSQFENLQQFKSY